MDVITKVSLFVYVVVVTEVVVTGILSRSRDLARKKLLEKVYDPF